MTRSVVQQTLSGLLAAALIFIVSIGSMGFIAFRINELNFWTLHTHQVIEELKDSLASLLDVETGDRGYIITGKKEFLETFSVGKVEALQHIDKVKKLTSDNPEQKESVKTLRAIAEEKIAFAEETIADTGTTKGAELIRSGKGHDIMKRFRLHVDTMINKELNLLEQRNSALQGFQQLLWFATGTLTATGSGILLWVYHITRKAIEDEKQRSEFLDSLNAKLKTEIEQRKKTEKALKDTTVKLTSSNSDLQRFAYVASHDLQEPLRAVSGFVTLISNKHKGQLDEETEGWIKHAVEGSSRMRTLINDLLAYARIESRGKELQRVNTSQALESAKKDLSYAIEESNVKIEADELPEVMGEEGQLTQVFQNLISNAIKFRGKENPVIKVSAKQQDGNWLFSVADNGIGFESEHAERIFVIFQRLHGREEYQGTGIGLALCKRIVERHGGRIWATSERGVGSTFFFTIPIIQNSQGAENG